MGTKSELLLTAKTLGLANKSYDLVGNALVGETDLVALALSNPPDDAKGARMKRAQLLTVAVARGNTPQQQLFEEAYGIGSEIALPPDVAEIVSPGINAIYKQTIEPQVCVSLDKKSYLPEDTTTYISGQAGECTFRQAQKILLAGFAAGLVLRDDTLTKEVATAVPSTLPEKFVDYQQLKVRLVDTLAADPSDVSEVLSGCEVASLEELEAREAFQRELLLPYIDTRLEAYIQSKQKRKVRIPSGKVVRRWSIDYEDAQKDQAATITEKPENLFSIAKRLGVQKALKEILAQDLQAGFIPQELETLMDIFILENGAKLVGCTAKEQSEAFSRFIREQREAHESAQKIGQYMEKTKYWELSGRRQVITPDTYEIGSQEWQAIQDINTSYLTYFNGLVTLYNQAVNNYTKSADARQFVDKLEGGLPNEVIPVCRELMALGGSIDSLRFDLIPSQATTYQVGEAQIISGGTPPAVLYRKAFEQAGVKDFIGEGILPAFVERCKQQTDDPHVVTLYSQRPYSSDISRTTSWAGNTAFIDELKEKGIKASTALPNDVLVRDDLSLGLQSDPDVKITTLYNRVDFVSPKAVATLRDPNMLGILKSYTEGKVDMFPAPLPILFGKGVYALIWDDAFLPLLEEQLGTDVVATLKMYTPRTDWITSETDQTNLDSTAWIRKGSYAHATQGLVMGPEVTRDTFIEQVAADAKNPYSAVLQAYIESDTPEFRTKKQYRTKDGRSYSVWQKTPYRLRVEPTSINGQVCEVFVTGSEDRIVHGRSDSIMTIASRKKED